MSSDAQATAIKALIATATGYPCLDHDEAKATTPLPSRYTEIYLSRRFGGNTRGGTQENDLRRLQTRAVATTVKNARLIEDRTADLFEHATHDVAGVLVHFAFESADSELEYDKDTQRYHRLTDWSWSV